MNYFKINGLTEDNVLLEELEQLRAVGDLMQSEGSRMSDWIRVQTRVPYEVYMAAVGFPTETWTNVRRKSKPIRKGSMTVDNEKTFTINYGKYAEKFKKGLEHARDTASDLKIKAEQRLDDVITEQQTDEKFFKAQITFSGTSGATRREVRGTWSQVAHEISKDIGQREVVITIIEMLPHEVDQQT